jgi:methylated-DNA-[protein]-cysteine S-methyltransferase
VSGARIETPLGPVTATEGDHGLVALAFGGLLGDNAASPVLDATRRQLEEYFAGERREFELPLAPTGTPFQRNVWNALAQVGYGETISYRALARKLGRPGAARAVGRANALNPLAIVIPCHRVVGASGALTGYGGGIERKRVLLELEAAGA